MGLFDSIVADIDKEQGGEGLFDTILNETPQERGFFTNLAESWTRGGENLEADLAIYEARFENKGSLNDALLLRKKLQRKEQLDPIEGNWMSNLAYGAAKTVPSLWKSAKASVKSTAVGAGIGVGTAAVAGQLGPQVVLPEELVTVPAGLLAGAKFGYMFGSMNFWFKQGAGAMFADFLDAGINPETAATAAQIAALPYAAIELMQWKALKPLAKAVGADALLKAEAKGLIKNRALDFVTNFGKRYATTLGKEVGEEVAQQFIEESAEDLAKWSEGKGLDFSPEHFAETAKTLYDTATGALESFALLPVPGLGLEAVSRQMGIQVKQEMESPSAQDSFNEYWGVFSTYDGMQTPEGFIQTSDVLPDIEESPLLKVQNAVEDSITRFAEQKAIRKEELGVKAAAAKEAIARVGGERGLIAGLGALKGELTKLGIEPLQNTIGVESIIHLYNRIATTDKLGVFEQENLYKAIKGLFEEGKILRPFEVEYANKVFGTAFANTLSALSEVVESKEVTIGDLLNLPRVTSAAADISFVARQGIALVGAWGKENEGYKKSVFLDSVYRGWKLFLGNEQDAKNLWKSYETDKFSDLRTRTPLIVNRYGVKGGGYFQRQEQFASRFVEKMPEPLKTLVRKSETAFTVGLNALRAEYFNIVAQEWVDTNTEILQQYPGAETVEDISYPVLKDKSQTGGKGYDLHDFEGLGHITNILTGEGDLKVLKRYAPFLNTTFFAPRLLAARVQALYEVANPTLSWAARKMLAYEMLKFFTISVGTFTLMSKIPGMDVEKDPRSTDWGKGRFGNTRIDFFGGFLPLIKMIIHLITGKRKTRGGIIVEQDYRDTIPRFLQSKLGPVPGFVLDWFRGQTFYGEDVILNDADIAWQFYNRMTPFILQDVIDAIKYNGVASGIVALPLTFHGVGVQTYPTSSNTSAYLRKDQLARQITGIGWDDLGPLLQNYLREHLPEIQTLEKTAKFENNDFDFVGTMVTEQRAAGKRIEEHLPGDVRKVMDENFVNVGGLSRRVGQNWFLNTENFDKYESKVREGLQAILPRVIRNPRFMAMNTDTKNKILTYLISQVKQSVREDLVNEATVKDFVTVATLRKRGVR